MERADLRHLVLPGLVLGVGMGGFVDGILLHQILQWHNMIASVVPPADLVSAKLNMFWDGLFHAFTWMATALGIGLLFENARAGRVRWSRTAFVGALLMGWGLFNLVEGVVDHLVLGVHHVRTDRAQLAWDFGFLVLGLVQLAVGAALVRRRRPGEALPRRKPVPA